MPGRPSVRFSDGSSSESLRDAPFVWHLFCRVIDHYGDAAILWRLARQLAREHGIQTHLFVDHPATLQQLEPRALPGACPDGVHIHAWVPDRLVEYSTPGPIAAPDVVLTGIDVAWPGYPERLVPLHTPWISYHYLSAEPWVGGVHTLPSPRPDGRIEHFWFPGFAPDTGGLLREQDLPVEQPCAPGPAAGQAPVGPTLNSPPTASLLCYPDAPLESLADALAVDATPPSPSPRLRLITPLAQHQLPDWTRRAATLAHRSGGALELLLVPFLPQSRYDDLLRSCHFNLVRGEDSWIRALWSGRPFLWQAYRQDDGSHFVKQEAFLALLPDTPLSSTLARLMRWWNGAPGAGIDRTDLAALLDSAAPLRWPLMELAQSQRRRPDGATQLVAFARALRQKRGNTL